ncbi:MAG: N-formylglutamate amidohydrolase, partial [Pseudohongiellaceae bacterium]
MRVRVMVHQFPRWFVFHVPHDSTWIPDAIRHQFALSDDALADELLKMTDHHTLDLFTDGIPAEQIVRAEVSRLVVDVERFADEAKEDMTKVGMGAVYVRTHNGLSLRHPLAEEERKILLSDWYAPHHAALTNKVDMALARFGKCLVVDCHSFPSTALPYEFDQSPDRPQICIGTDAFHTPVLLGDHLIHTIVQEGFTAKKDSPFKGALVPSKFYEQDKRVSAVMIEVRRDLYMNEESGEKTSRFAEIAEF